MMWLALFAACRIFPAPSTSDGTEQTESVELDFGFDRPQPENQWTAQELEQWIHDWSNDHGIPISQQVHDRYLEVLTYGDEKCPGEGPDMYHLNGCTSDDGMSYTGLVLTYDDDYRKNGIGLHRMGFTLADFVMTYPDGGEFAGGGNADLVMSYENTGLTSQVHITGAWQDDQSELTWLRETGSFDFFTTRISNELNIHGSLSTGDYALRFDQLKLISQTCEAVPQDGEMMIRQDDGSWVSVMFGTDCSGCGIAVWNEEYEIGEICPDISTAALETYDMLADVESSFISEDDASDTGGMNPE